MKKYTSLWIAWGILYVVCTALAFIPNPPGALYGIMVLLAVAFFLPPALVLYRAIPREHWSAVRFVRNLSFIILALTLVAIILNLLSIGASKTVGDVLYGLLIVVSSPVVCGQSWIIGLFGWALLWTVSRINLKKAK